MGSNKRDLEIIYNLQWKNGNGTGHNDKSNIVGMYDIPATTLNWETFKSYLLKNSGALVDDVKVSYVSSDDKEFPIESQLDFQIALYSFRQRARSNDVITLKLERVCDKMLRIKRQRQHVEGERVPTAPPVDEIPDWFKDFMKEYKKEVVEEVTASVVNAISSVKLQGLGRKLKETSTKRLRKSGENNEKEIRKTLKLERKIEELEEKTNKIKEKKLALSRCTEGRNRPIGLPISDTEILMDAAPIGKAEIIVPHMSGGEIYRQEWIVANTGSIPWTSETELRYAWGSEALKPIEKTVVCPLLKPGEKGCVAVLLEVPSVAGEYESYWHFSHNGRRFGHWLGCHVTVDQSPIKVLSVHRFNPADKSLTVEPPSAVSWSSQSGKTQILPKEIDESVAAVSTTLEDLTLICSDSDNQSVVSVADSSSSVHTTRSDEFVVVPIETEADIKPPANEQKSRYAYISLDGKKQAVPKMFLRADYLESAEEADIPETENVEDPDNKRLFVFPLNCPGFEVVYPPNPMSESILACSRASSIVVGEDALLENEIKNEEPVVETNVKEEKLSTGVTSSTFITSSPSTFCNDTVPIFHSPMNISTIPPPPPIRIAVPPPPTIPMAPPPPTIPIPPPPTISVPPPTFFTCNAPSTNPWLYQTPSNPSGPFIANGPMPYPNVNCGYPLMHSYMYSNNEGYCTPPLQPQPGSYLEGDDRSTSPNNVHIPSVHIIPETLVSGAVNVASSAINTARSVLNMFTSPSVPQAQPMPPPAPPQLIPQPTQEVPQVDPSSPREKAQKSLREMGFWDRELNNTLLERFHDDIGRVVTELVK